MSPIHNGTLSDTFQCVAKYHYSIFYKNPSISTFQQGNAQCMDPTKHFVGNPIFHGIVDYCSRMPSVLSKKERRSGLKLHLFITTTLSNCHGKRHNPRGIGSPISFHNCMEGKIPACTCAARKDLEGQRNFNMDRGPFHSIHKHSHVSQNGRTRSGRLFDAPSSTVQRQMTG